MSPPPSEGERYRVAVLSSTTWGRNCILEGILPVADVELCGVLTTPGVIEISWSERPVTISMHDRFDDVVGRAGALLHRSGPRVIRADYERFIDACRPRLVLAIGWYFMVPARVRALVPDGVLGMHCSMLPRYRGGAPIPWAIINGESQTGVSMFHLEDGVDAGDIVVQRAIPIGPDESSAEVYGHATAASIDMLREVLPAFAAGDPPRTVQDHAAATEFPQRGPEDGRIDWSRSARQVHDLVRAVTRPYPGAFFEHPGGRVMVWRTAVAGSAAVPPGHVAEAGARCRIACGGGGSVELLEVGLPDGAVCSGVHAARALGWRAGEPCASSSA